MARLEVAAPRFTALDPSHLRLRHIEPLGNRALRLGPPKSPDLGNLGSSQRDPWGVLAASCGPAPDRAVGGARVVAPLRGHELLATRYAGLRRHVHPLAVRWPRGVHGRVCRTIHDLQVLDPVVILDSVPVMDKLVVPQRAAKVLAHDEPVFEDVAVLSGIRVAVATHQDVRAARGGGPPTVPSRVALAPVCVAREVDAGDSPRVETPHGGATGRGDLRPATAMAEDCHAGNLAPRDGRNK